MGLMVCEEVNGCSVDDEYQEGYRYREGKDQGGGK
jgi:hypothetical protein